MNETQRNEGREVQKIHAFTTEILTSYWCLRIAEMVNKKVEMIFSVLLLGERLRVRPECPL